MTISRLVTMQEAADHYGVALSTLRSWVSRGEGPVPTLSSRGHFMGYTESAILKFDEDQTMTRGEWLRKHKKRGMK